MRKQEPLCHLTVRESVGSDLVVSRQSCRRPGQIRPLRPPVLFYGRSCQYPFDHLFILIPPIFAAALTMARRVAA